jgi:hypothetical protein
MRCPTRGVHAVGRLIALRGGRLCDEGWNERVAQRPLRDAFRDGWCGVPQCFTQQPSLCCNLEAHGWKDLSFCGVGAVRVSRII